MAQELSALVRARCTYGEYVDPEGVACHTYDCYLQPGETSSGGGFDCTYMTRAQLETFIGGLVKDPNVDGELRMASLEQQWYFDPRQMALVCVQYMGRRPTVRGGARRGHHHSPRVADDRRQALRRLRLPTQPRRRRHMV